MAPDPFLQHRRTVEAVRNATQAAREETAEVRRRAQAMRADNDARRERLRQQLARLTPAQDRLTSDARTN